MFLSGISKLYPLRIKRKFIYKAKISKKNYLEMIRKRYISTLLTLTKRELSKGIEQINSKYGDTIKFKDKLTCLIL